MTFTDELRTVAEPIWDATLEHPMVEGIGDGTLDPAPFRHWVCQDYVFLIEYSRVFALGGAHAPDLDRMSRFASLFESTINTEMDLHRSYAGAFDITDAELEATEPTPTTQAYTDFLVRSGYEGFGETVAALLPCMWGFNVTAKRLAERGRPEHELYDQWIEMYAGEEFTTLTEWCKDTMNAVAKEAPPRQRETYHDRFHTSARYEYLFWDGAWNREEWPL